MSDVFPSYLDSDPPHLVGKLYEPREGTGLSKRELFAALAMQGILTSMSTEEPCWAELIAGSAVECADALIKALETPHD